MLVNLPDEDEAVREMCDAYDRCVDYLGDSAMERYCNDVPMRAVYRSLSAPTAKPRLVGGEEDIFRDQTATIEWLKKSVRIEYDADQNRYKFPSNDLRDLMLALRALTKPSPSGTAGEVVWLQERLDKLHEKKARAEQCSMMPNMATAEERSAIITRNRNYVMDWWAARDEAYSLAQDAIEALTKATAKPEVV